MFQINRSLVPIKAHYFFFMAAMGPILPQINVFGKQLGISPDIMGFVTSFLPFMYMPAKPLIGYLIDYFPNLRKTIFMTIILITIGCFTGFAFIPKVLGNVNLNDNNTIDVDYPNIVWCNDNEFTENRDFCGNFLRMDCEISNNTFNGIVTTISNHIVMKTTKCISNISIDSNSALKVHCKLSNAPYGDCFYKTFTFWIFIVLTCFGTVGFNVSNCVSDAICFDMLGDNQTRYGKQRVWGTIGFGVTALLSGIAVHMNQTKQNDLVETIAPAVIIMIVFGVFDIISIKWLKLPKFTEDGESIVSKVCDLMTQKPIAIFLIFATIAGILDSFIIYYLFWYLEEIAEQTNYMSSIKLIEGCVVAAECLGGEIIFLLISGKILKRIGYVHCLSLCFFLYAIRFFLISMIPNPWWLVAIEIVMQGCTYALTYTCIVAYASVVAPPGTTATVQGLVAGMDDGVGFAIGSIIGGQMYKKLGGRISFKVFACAAVITGIAHIFLRPSERKIRSNEIENEKKNTSGKDYNGKCDLTEMQPLKNDSNAIII